ncbi:MAG: hypothetical protein IIX44_10830 [Clostridia bacterium]|nr:hypothetical protein [Clostridia bacterium]
MKRIISALLLLSMLTASFGFAIPAAAEVVPADTVVVDLALSAAAGTATDIKVGDKTYSVVVGTTGFSTLGAALEAVPAGGTVILAAGTYAEGVTIKKDVTILGPKAGINPNVKGNEKTDDWTRNPERGQGEAVLTTSWHVGINAPNKAVYDCHNVTIDGIAISGAGMLRSNYGVAGNITLTYKNMLVYGYTTSGNGPFYCYSYYPDKAVNDYSRNLICENIRFEGMTTAPGFNLDVDAMDASGIYFDAASTKQMFGFIAMSSVVQAGGEAIYTVRDSMFRQKTNQILNCNVTTGAGGHNMVKNVAGCSKVTVNITNNVFIDNDSGVASNNNIIVPQIKSDNVYFNIIDNVFKVSGVASDNFIAIHGATDSRDLASKFVVKGNTFDNIPTALSLPQSTTEVDMKDNTYRSPKDDPAKSVVDGVPSTGTVDKSAKTLKDSVTKDEYKVAITTSAGNTFKVYSDKELTKEMANPVKLYKETNTFYIKIMSANGVKEEVYTATVTTTNPAKLFFDIENEVRWLGRTYSMDGKHYFNWSASGFEFSFKGSGVRAEIVSNAPGGGNNAYIKIFIDGVEQPDVVLTKANQTVTLAEGLDPNSTHTIRVVKRSNARSSTAALVSLKLNDGEKLAPPAEKARLIEFVGDSITVGYSASKEASTTTSWSTATEDATKTYSEYIANAFGADYSVIAVSGRGIARNYGNTTERLIPLLYASLDDYNREGVKYDFKRKADVIVINAGTNDASGSVTGLTAAEFSAALKSFLLDVRAKNPDAEIIYAYGMMSTGWTPQIKQVVEELRSSGDTHITYLKLKPCSGKELGIASHPTADAYISRGDAIIELIEQLTGWKAGEAPEIPETTTAPETEAPVVTEAPAITEAPATTEAPAVTEPAPEKKGCGASAVSAAAVVGAIATAVALKKKRDEE